MKEFDIQTFMVKSEGIGVKGQFEKNFWIQKTQDLKLKSCVFI